MSQLEYNTVFDAISQTAEETADLQFRADLMLLLRKLFEAEEMSPKDIATRLGVSPPRISELLHGKIHLFSSDKLIGFLAKMNIRFRPEMLSDKTITCRIEAA